MWLSPLTRFKLVAALLVFIAGWGGVALPWALRRLQSGERYLSLASVLSAGVMLGGGLLHLLPDAAAEVSEAWHGEYPLGYLLFTLGLLLPLVVETLVEGGPGSSSAGRNEDEWATPLQEQHAADASEVTLCCSSGRKVNGRTLGESDAEAVGAEGLPISRPVPLSSALVLLGALSFHSVLEGLAQGTTTSLETSVVLLSAILLHKGLAAFALGCLLLNAGISRSHALGLGLAFALATPAGSLLGMLVPTGGEVGSLVSSGLVAMAGGSFTFVALLEILPRELSSHALDRRDRSGRDGSTASKLSKLVALGAGFGAMALLANWL